MLKRVVAVLFAASGAPQVSGINVTNVKDFTIGFVIGAGVND